jgi:hypothetical protein
MEIANMETNAKVIITNKDGTTEDGLFISTKSGWTVVAVKGVERKVRSGQVAAKLTKAEVKKIESAARKAEKVAQKAESKVEGKERLVPADLSHYVLHEDKTASGRRKIDINDDTAEKLRELDLEGTYKYAASILDENAKELKAKYANLNPGMQRMNLGNRIRKAFRLAAEAAEDVKDMKKSA